MTNVDAIRWVAAPGVGGVYGNYEVRYRAGHVERVSPQRVTNLHLRTLGGERLEDTARRHQGAWVVTHPQA